MWVINFDKCINRYLVLQHSVIVRQGQLRGIAQRAWNYWMEKFNETYCFFFGLHEFLHWRDLNKYKSIFSISV